MKLHQARSMKLHPYAGSRHGARGEAEHELHPWVGSRRGTYVKRSTKLHP
jgi:hypothetical protein